MSLTLITPTGGRHEAFSICEHWIDRQTYSKVFQWIVVDDYTPRTACTLGQTVIHPDHQWRPGRKTLAKNLLAALPHVKNEFVLIIEDDDWYSPEYLSVMNARLEDAFIVGESHSVYYHVGARKYNLNGNVTHSSLCQTGFHASLLPMLAQICQTTNGFIDVALFDQAFSQLFEPRLYMRSGLHLGIKGLPGRPGIGMGHDLDTVRSWKSDLSFRYLHSVVGTDVEMYKQYYQGGF